MRPQMFCWRSERSDVGPGIEDAVGFPVIRAMEVPFQVIAAGSSGSEAAVGKRRCGGCPDLQFSHRHRFRSEHPDTYRPGRFLSKQFDENWLGGRSGCRSSGGRCLDVATRGFVSGFGTEQALREQIRQQPVRCRRLKKALPLQCREQARHRAPGNYSPVRHVTGYAARCLSRCRWFRLREARLLDGGTITGKRPRW